MRMQSYPIGTKRQQKTGRVEVKVLDDNGKPKWEAEARRLWELYHGELKPGDRVFLIRGTGSKIERGNLTMIHFRTADQDKFKVLAHTRILYMPIIRTIDKRTGKVLVNS